MDAPQSDISIRLGDAMAQHQAGQLTAAVAGYEEVLVRDPANFDALHFLGGILLETGNAKRAVDLLERALDVHPEAFPAIHQLGKAYVAVGRNDDAAIQFVRASTLAPDYAPAHKSLASFRYGQGRFDDAVTEFAAVARLRPDDVGAHVNLGTALGQLDRFVDALRCFERALDIAPLDLTALANAANVSIKLGRPVDAAEYFLKVIAQQPAQAKVCYQAGFLFYSQGMRAEARSAFDLALQRDPEFVEARWARMIAELPLAYGPDEDPATFRARFSDALEDIDDWFDATRTHLGPRAVGIQQPFYLAFHEVDVLPLLTRYGDLCVRLMSALPPAGPVLSRPRTAGSAIRLAIASGFIHDQSVWTALVRGWCAHIDRRQFELHLFYTGSASDSQTAVAQAQATSFHTGLAGLPQWVDAIEQLKPDVLLYPELGMDATCAKLACLRLAPVQAASWGHPVTTGMPTIDYYLSAELFEPPEGASHYREQLVLLPNLGCYYQPLNPAGAEPDWVALGIDPTMPRLVCAGTPYKYFPEHDHLFVEIAQRLGRCQFLFFQDMAPRLSRQLSDRLASAFRHGGLDADRFVRFLPRHARPAFFGLMRGCNVYLDTIGFSGFNSAIQAVECGLPVVTWEGRFMRGRLGAGVLRRTGMDDLIVHDSGGYVDTVVRLCQDSKYASDVRQRMAAQMDVLFRDIAPVRALEDFLVKASARR